MRRLVQEDGDAAGEGADAGAAGSDAEAGSEETKAKATAKAGAKPASTGSVGTDADSAHSDHSGASDDSASALNGTRLVSPRPPARLLSIPTWAHVCLLWPLCRLVAVPTEPILARTVTPQRRAPASTCLTLALSATQRVSSPPT